MDGTKKKAGSGKGDRVPALFRDLLEKCRQNNFEDYVMPAILSQKPKAGHMWNTYLMDKESVSGNSCETFHEIIKVYVAFPNFDKSGHPQRVYIKNTKVSSFFLNILCSVMPKYDRINTLKLIDCNLSKQAIEILHDNLSNMPNITEITLDGNPITSQNHGLIAFSDSLEYLSLKRCKINEIGLEKLYQNLCEGHQSKLKILNLTGNYINDTAALVIEKILRENRSINTLILADNWITDAGCFSIMSALQKFMLNENEMIKRRTITINYFRRKVEMVYKKQMNIPSFVYMHYNKAEEYKKHKLHVRMPPTPPSSAKTKKSGKSKKKETGRRTLLNNEVNKQVSEYIENILPKITHPFICDTESKDGNLICSGNMILGLLNLGFNRLTIKGYTYIIEVLNYQFTKELTSPGLSYIILNGNLDMQSYEFEEINQLIHEKLWRMETKQKSIKASTDIEAIALSSANSTA